MSGFDQVVHTDPFSSDAQVQLYIYEIDGERLEWEEAAECLSPGLYHHFTGLVNVTEGSHLPTGGPWVNSESGCGSGFLSQ